MFEGLLIVVLCGIAGSVMIVILVMILVVIVEVV